MVTATKEINWASVIQSCARERFRTITAFFPFTNLSMDLVNARDREAELQAFTPADLEAIRQEPFDNDSRRSFEFFVAALNDLMKQLYDGPQRGYEFTWDTDEEGYFFVYFYVTDQIGQHMYTMQLFVYCDECRHISTWGDFLDTAYDLAQWAIEKLKQWNADRPSLNA